MDAAALNPRALFDGNVCYEIPPFQRPYVWNEEDQWQPLWDDITRVADTLINSSEAVERDESRNHFLGAVVLKLRDSPAGEVSKRSVIDGQQRLTTLQLVLDAAQLVLDEYGDADDAESIQELVFNGARRFRNTPSRFKLWPSRVDRHAFEFVMDNELAVTPDASASRIHQAHSFFFSAIRQWADVSGDPDKAKSRLSVLAQVLQQHLQIVAINLSASDDDQLIFETLNDRGTPLLAADLIKNYLFQRCEEIGADVDTWSETYWQDFDEDWWRDQVAQGRLYRSRIDLFLQYWLTMRLRDEILSEALFARFRTFADAYLHSPKDAEAFLRSLRHDADSYRDLVTREGGSPAAGFYGRVIEQLELGSFIPLLLWFTSDNHAVPDGQVERALNAVESMTVRRTLLRMTTKDFNTLVVATLKALDGEPIDQAGEVVESYLARQTAESRTWPTDDALREQLPAIRLYGNVKQPRLRVVLSALELRSRSDRHETVTLPAKLEIEHIMPRGWRTYWGSDIQGNAERAAKRDIRVNTLGNLTLVTKKLNGSLSNRPWGDADAAVVASTGREAGIGKRSLLNRYSILVLNKDIVESHEDSWTEGDIQERSRQLTEAIISIWPRPTPASS
jgi:hypothetical protein